MSGPNRTYEIPLQVLQVHGHTILFIRAGAFSLFVFGSSMASKKVSWIPLVLQYFSILQQRTYKELKYMYNFYKSYIQVHMMLFLPCLIALAR